MRVKNTNYLYEGLTYSDVTSVLLWENAGKKIVEANLTADQINQLFTGIEQGATAAGGNRTLLGKGKDVASAVNQAWEDLKTKVQNSGPIQKVDAMYDQAAEKLKQATGGDAGVMKYVQKYRDFAQKHPVAQSLIYSALIAAAGISGAGLGGAAALGLFKMVDKLLQGEKFSSAAYSGAKTGAMAYGASKIGDLVRGDQGAAPTPQGSNSMDNSYDNYVTKNPTTTTGPGEFAQQRGNSGFNRMSSSPTIVGPDGVSRLATPQEIAAAKAALRAGNAPTNESIKLTPAQINLIFESVNDSLLLEGIRDFIGKAANWAKTKGANLTNKITADKLQQAWKAAGSPTDSEEIVKILQSAGVDSAIIDKSFTDLGISRTAPTAGATPSSAPTTSTGSPTATGSGSVSSTLKVGQITQVIPTLRMRDLKSIQRTIDSALAKRSTKPAT